MTSMTIGRMDDSYVERKAHAGARPALSVGGGPEASPGGDNADAYAEPMERLADLLPLLQRHAELDLETLAYHLQQSDATAADGYCHAAINEARSFLEALVMGIAVARQREAFGKFRRARESKSGFRLGTLYLRTLGLIDEEEELLLQHMYGIASAKGSHHGMADALWCRLVRRMIGMAVRYLLDRYRVWVEAGCPATADADDPQPSSPASEPLPPSGRWLPRVVTKLLGGR